MKVKQHIPKPLRFTLQDFSDDDSANKLRKLVKCWNNRLVLHGSLWKQYVEGRLSIVIYVHVTHRTDNANNPPVSYCNSHPTDSILLIIVEANIPKCRNLDSRNQQVVFVGDVQSVQGPEGAINSIIRFYDIYDSVINNGKPSLYWSAIDGIYKFFLGRPERKSAFRTFTEGRENKLVPSQIKGTADVVDSVANNERQVVWRGFQALEVNSIASQMGISIDDKAITLRIMESGDLDLQVIDMLLGPFNLEP